MIQISDLTYSYNMGTKAVLKGINLHIRPGEHIALIGPNGCGKTTLIRHFNALLLPASGQVSIDGLDSRDPDHHKKIRCRVGMLFQNPDHQIVGMSVEEDVAFGPDNLGLAEVEVSLRVHKALEMVGLKGFEKSRPHTLSGGEKQLLALAGLLAMEPRYIVMDESTSSLDPLGKSRVWAILDQLKAEGMAIIQVTHNMDEALRAERVVLMADGQVVADGEASEILADALLLERLGLARPLVLELIGQLKPVWQPAGRIKTVAEAVRQIKLWMQPAIAHGQGDGLKNA